MSDKEKIVAPWTDAQVEALNRHQVDQRLHPYTCGNCRQTLVATTAGWSCPQCGNTQNWAWHPQIDLLPRSRALIKDAIEKLSDEVGEVVFTPAQADEVKRIVDRHVATYTRAWKLLRAKLGLLEKEDKYGQDVLDGVSRLLEWREAVLDAAVVHWVDSNAIEDDPRKLLNATLATVAREALDPLISEDARKLVNDAAPRLTTALSVARVALLACMEAMESEDRDKMREAFSLAQDQFEGASVEECERLNAVVNEYWNNKVPRDRGKGSSQ